jgi:hypothetical protein
VPEQLVFIEVTQFSFVSISSADWNDAEAGSRYAEVRRMTAACGQKITKRAIILAAYGDNFLPWR